MKYLFLMIMIVGSVFTQNMEYIKMGINHVEVRGTAEIIVQTDEAKFSFTMEATGSTLKKAVENAQKKVQRVISSLVELGMDKKEIETSRFFSNENYGDKSFFTSKNDYKSSLTVSLTFTDLALLEKAIFLVSDSKPEYMSAVDFNLKNIDEHKTKALDMAVKSAYTKAVKLVANSSSKVGKLIFSSVEDFYAQPMMANVRGGRSKMSFDSESSVMAEPMIHAQNRTIRVTVRAIYQVD